MPPKNAKPAGTTLPTPPWITESSSLDRPSDNPAQQQLTLVEDNSASGTDAGASFCNSNAFTKQCKKSMYFFHRSDIQRGSGEREPRLSSVPSDGGYPIGVGGRYTLGRLGNTTLATPYDAKLAGTHPDSAEESQYSAPSGENRSSAKKVSCAYSQVASVSGLVHVLRQPPPSRPPAPHAYSPMRPRPSLLDEVFADTNTGVSSSTPPSLNSPYHPAHYTGQPERRAVAVTLPTRASAPQATAAVGAARSAPETARDDIVPEAVGLTPVLATTTPKGRYVVLNLLSTWGDAHEIGLCGVELFNEHGVRILPVASADGTPPLEGSDSDRRESTQAITVEQHLTSLTYSDKSLCMLAEYSSSAAELAAARDAAELSALGRDPRRQLRSIVNGVVNTRGEDQMFAMPYTPGNHHLVCFVFSFPVTLSMIRVHNYNGKGRVHTTKGVRVMEITMDDVVVFRGEIAQSSGELLTEESQVGLVNCENILFTADPQVLTKVMASGHTGEEGEDRSRASRQASRGIGGGITLVLRNNRDDLQEYVGGSAATMAMTSGNSAGALCGVAAARQAASSSAARPLTGGVAVSGSPPQRNSGSRVRGAMCVPGLEPPSQAPAVPVSRKAQYPTHCPCAVDSLSIMFLSTWGDNQHVGLSGLRLRDANGDCIRESVSGVWVRYPSGAYQDPDEHEEMRRQVSHLFDESIETACTLPFMMGMQLIVRFNEPISTLGFLEVANYSVAGSTFCGAKDVRVFLATCSGNGGPRPEAPLPSLYEHLWVLGSSTASRQTLQQWRVLEVTPTEGVSLRKAPAYLTRPRFQTYDLSLQSSGPIDPDITSPLSHDVSLMGFHIGVGPGTGGDGTLNSDGGAFMGAGRPGMHVANASFANSLNASMNIRAAMAMKRARMMLRERTPWLLNYQPYMTPLLPVGYVLRVRMHLCARSVGQPTGAHPIYIPAQETIKGYMKAWVVQPMQSVVFFNESGIPITPMPPGPATTQAIAELADREDEPDVCIIPMVSECVLTTLPTPAVVAATNVNVSLDLLYVADVPFCLSALRVTKPLVLNGSAAWVKRLQLHMDDTMVFDSGDASLQVTNKASTGDTEGGNDVSLPQCSTSLKPFVIFTLDPKILADIESAVQVEQVA